MAFKKKVKKSKFWTCTKCGRENLAMVCVSQMCKVEKKPLLPKEEIEKIVDIANKEQKEVVDKEAEKKLKRKLRRQQRREKQQNRDSA